MATEPDPLHPFRQAIAQALSGAPTVPRRPIRPWMEAALDAPPSAGNIGRMELVAHWEGLSSRDRRAVLLLLRDMAREKQDR